MSNPIAEIIDHLRSKQEREANSDINLSQAIAIKILQHEETSREVLDLRFQDLEVAAKLFLP